IGRSSFLWVSAIVAEAGAVECAATIWTFFCFEFVIFVFFVIVVVHLAVTVADELSRRSVPRSSVPIWFPIWFLHVILSLFTAISSASATLLVPRPQHPSIPAGFVRTSILGCLGFQSIDNISPSSFGLTNTIATTPQPSSSLCCIIACASEIF